MLIVPASGRRRPRTTTSPPGERMPPDSVRVADRNNPEQRRLARHEAPAVPGALTGGTRLQRRNPRDELEGRLEVAGACVLAERIEAVEGDPAAGHVEPGPSRAQQCGAVLRVRGNRAVLLAQRLEPGREAVELLLEEARVGLVGGREVGHHARKLERIGREDTRDEPVRERAVAGAQTAHPSVELDVYPAASLLAHPVEQSIGPGDHLGAGGERLYELIGESVRPSTMIGAAIPAARSSAASAEVATASTRAPPARTALADATAPWP